MFKEKFIEDFLVGQGIITAARMEDVKKEMKISGLGLQEIIGSMGIISEEQLTKKLAEVFAVPYMDLKSYLFDTDVIKLIPDKIAKKYEIVPLYVSKGVLTIAMSDPHDVVAIDAVRAVSPHKIIQPVFAMPSSIRNVIDQYYTISEDVETIIDKVTKETKDGNAESIDERRLVEMAEEAPVIKIMNMIIMQAVKRRASDIHIEPQENMVYIRYRIDGVLHHVNELPKAIDNLLISRIKIMAQLDIAERRKPQDGKIRLRMENKDLDLRVSSLPTLHGENIVIRILDKTALCLNLGDIGMPDSMLKKFEEIIHRPYGIILVTGPTGSGKTTTLYSALSKINSIEKNIITVEDPVEYQIPLVRQTQVNSKAGYEFVTGLRSILRQDPDIIMVGEIRDMETADISIRASLTGHLVFSTLHTNDASSAIVRLVDMGIEPFLIASSVIGILAQRLVRVICNNCKQEYKATQEELEVLKIEQKDVTLYRGKGCDKCMHSGYVGRKGIFELLVIENYLIRSIMDRESSEKIANLAREKRGMITLREDAIDKVLKGITTVEEAVRVT